MVDQVSAHGSTGNSEKVAPVPPIAISGADKTDIDLIDKFGRLKGMTLALALHQEVCEAAKVGEDDVEEFALSVGTALAPTLQEPGDVARLRHKSYLGWAQFSTF
jgi:hypothetical protein